MKYENNEIYLKSRKCNPLAAENIKMKFDKKMKKKPNASLIQANTNMQLTYNSECHTLPCSYSASLLL